MTWKPRLAVLAGPLEGKVFEIGDADLSLGRHGSNSVQLRDITVSRHHCVVRPADSSCVVTDLDSRHGTFVNGVPVRERRLTHGDFLRLGDSLFLFLEALEGPPESGALVRLSTGGLAAETTLEVPLGGSRYLTPEALLTPEAGVRTARHLQALLAISGAVHALREPEALAGRFLELLSTVVPAERLALLVVTPAGKERTFAHATGEPPSPQRPLAISRTLAERVRTQRVAVLCNDVRTELGDAESLQSARIASLICAPLEAPGRPPGLLYADSRDPAGRFDQDHLELMTAAAGIAGAALANALHLEWLEDENRRLRTAGLEHEMIGESPAMQRVVEFLARAAPTDATVLLRGESGTGKELAARALHVSSARAGGPFVAINCATLSEHLLESDLFGHERGAFTGAVARKTGKFELAHGGTLFLDEVAEIPPALQAKLLRVLEQRRFERVGGTAAIEVDVRVIAATNRDLEAAIRGGEFREDLYYRLNVISLEMPPLRQRRDDIPLLASHFAARYGQRCNRPVVGISPATRKCLVAYDWPGNVRELANAVERAVVLGSGEVIRPEDLPEAVVEAGSAGGASPTGFHEAVAAAKRKLIEDALAATGGHVSRAAASLGLHPNYLHRLITNLGLRGDGE